MNMRIPLVKLGSVLRRVGRFEKRDDLLEYRFAGTYSFGRGIFVGEKKTGSSFQLDKIQRIRTGDFVYCKIMAWEGAFGLVPEQCNGCVMSGAFVVYEVDTEKIDPNFLDYYFKIKSNWDAIGSQSTGTNVRRRSLHPNQFEVATIPNPPLDEQRRIVARIEELAARIEEARELRRQAVEETSALLKSSRKAIVEALREHYPDTRLGDVCKKITDGPHVSPSYVSKGIPFISVRNISESGLDFSTAKYVSEADHKIFSQKAKVERGDVLYTKGGTTGVAHRVDTDKDFSIWVHVALLKLDKDKVCDGFVEHMLNAPSSKAQALEYTHGSSNKDLGLTRMCNILFPVPPISDQGHIVGYLDGLQSKLDALKRHQAETAAELDALLPAVLERSFRGEL
jgi:type I restriction enzyme, S subunit